MRRPRKWPRSRRSNKPGRTRRPRRPPPKRRSGATRSNGIIRSCSRRRRPRRVPRKPRIRPSSGRNRTGGDPMRERFHLRRDERGMSLVFVAVGFMAMLSAAALANQVGGQAVSVLPEDVTFPNDPTGQPTRVAVHVFRTAARTNPVPTLMGTFFGVQQVDIDAIATAEASAANAMTCVKPFMIPDRWQEKNKPPNTTFDKFTNKGVLLPDADVYIGLRPYPDPNTNYTGYTTTKNTGDQLTLRAGTGDNINPSFYFSWKMPGDTGGDFYRDNIANCNQSIMTRGTPIIQEPGDKSGPTIQGIQAL